MEGVIFVIQVNDFGFNSVVGRQRVSSEIDYIDNDGVLHHGSQAVSIMVRSESDLMALPPQLPGTIAYTAGWKKAWQLNAAGTWVVAIGE